MLILLAPLALGQGVVGGEPAPEGRWPEIAAVMSGGVAFCTGTLVAPDVVLTAGHCVDGARVTGVKLDAPNWVTAGVYHAVDEAIAYPDWERTYDVAVLILEEPSDIPPRRIAQGCIVRDDLVDGAPVAIAGYGATAVDGSGFTFQLNEGYTSIVHADCASTLLGCNGSVMPGGELVAGGDGVDTCFGDSGGPLYLLSPRGELLAGVTSRTFAEYGEYPCQQGGIYVRADAVVDWIEETTGRDLPPAVCGYPPAPDGGEIVIDGPRKGRLELPANDLDEEDRHDWEVVLEPAHGKARVQRDGTAVYVADRDYVGPDRFVVRVTDDSRWALSTDVEVTVDVISATGCDTGRGPTSGWATLAASLALLAQRRGARRLSP